MGTTNASASAPTWQRYQGTPAEIYERYFVPAIGTPFAAKVVQPVAPQPGERVIDIACGTGVVARMAADLVGETGTVVGIDGHPGMLAAARQSSTSVSGVAIDWRQASAEGLPFADDSFDVALCSLGLQFFADKPRALTEMRRVVAPGGRVAIGTVGPTPPLFEALHDVLAERFSAELAAFVHAVFSFDDPGRLHDLLAAAGFGDIETTRRPVQLHLGPPAEFFWSYALGTPLAEAVAPLPDSERAALEAAVVERWQPFVTDIGLDMEVGLVLGTATDTA